MSESPRPNWSELVLGVALNGGFPEQPARLSRRNRHVIVDADFYGTTLSSGLFDAATVENPLTSFREWSGIWGSGHRQAAEEVRQAQILRIGQA